MRLGNQKLEYHVTNNTHLPSGLQLLGKCIYIRQNLEGTATLNLPGVITV